MRSARKLGRGLGLPESDVAGPGPDDAAILFREPLETLCGAVGRIIVRDQEKIQPLPQMVANAGFDEVLFVADDRDSGEH